jgi:hypothetical protein
VTYSVPVGAPRVEFNAHRRFSSSEALALFPSWEIVDRCVLGPSPIEWDDNLEGPDDRDLTACFAVRKPPGPGAS